MRHLAATLALVLAACTGSSGVQAIVGAKLIATPGAAPVEYSVIVIENGRFKAVGPQSSTPVPKGAEITRGLGMTVVSVPGYAPIAPGRPANLLLESTDLVVRTMRDGRWIK
jgi:hypothetical protein